MKYISIDDEKCLAQIVVVMDSTLFVGLYGIPQRGGYYYLASNFSECGYVETEDEAKQMLQEWWESER